METNKSTTSGLSKQLEKQINNILGELMLLGLRVMEDDNRIRVITQDPDSDGKVLFDRDRQYFDSSTLADLVNVHESVIFLRGVGELKDRIAALGWSIYDDSSSYGRRTTLQMDDGWSTSYERTRKNLIDIQERVERAEQAKRIYESYGLIDQAGINLKVNDESFEFTLQENDPAIKRRLTKENVDVIIAIARTLNELKKGK